MSGLTSGWPQWDQTYDHDVDDAWSFGFELADGFEGFQLPGPATSSPDARTSLARGDVVYTIPLTPNSHFPLILRHCVPEPTTLLLLASGVMLLGSRRDR